ncbi:MAG TPA: site-specific DNA-methyltransferase [Chitinophagaceae bacterium]|nr:site-specific DNA-methyltransferase [Chitinophagaceae bacterium]
MEVNKIYNEDCLAGLKKLPDQCVNCCVTSPPYFGLRDYGNDAQIGLEDTPEKFVESLVAVFTEVRRVLKDDGTLWLNLGDSYAAARGYQVVQSINGDYKIDEEKFGNRPAKVPKGLKAKDLIGIPWMVAFALRSAGWYLRQDIIWHKPNPMPESVTDRCTKSHEYIFLLSKSSKYYYDIDAIRTEQDPASLKRLERGWNGNGDRGYPNGPQNHIKDYMGKSKEEIELLSGANKRSVWSVTTKPYSDAHFATFPEELIVDCIKAGSSEHGCCSSCGKSWERDIIKSGQQVFIEEKEDQGRMKASGQIATDTSRRKQMSGQKHAEHKRNNPDKDNGWKANCDCNAPVVPSIILDPFMGAGTTAVVAKKLNRNYIGFELNPDYIKIANKRLYKEIGMFL